MKIYMDITVLTLATFITGIQRVTREIALRLLECRQEEIVLLHYHAKENQYHIVDNERFTAYYRLHKGIKNKMITRNKIAVADMRPGDVFFDLDAVWMCRLKRSYLLPLLKKQGVRIVAHIYDIISITHPQYCLERGVYHFMDYIAAHLQYADDLIVNAGATRDELRKLAEQLGTQLPPCHVVPLGADFRQQAPVAEEEVPKQVREAAKAAPYILMVGTIEPRKNHRLLLEAYDKGLKQAGYHIILAGYMGWNMEEFARKLYSHPDYGRGIYHFDGLEDASIDYLYQHARFLAFCSYTEGFGLPLLESIQRGTPVIAADIPVSREVAGEYCDWFEQDDPAGLCRIVREYEDEQRYQERKNKLMEYRPVSWKQCCGQVEKILEGQ